MLTHRLVPLYLQITGLFLVAFVSQVTCNAKSIFRRDPLDGALDASLIVIVRQQSQGMFQVEEVFLGRVVKGQSLALPGFRLAVEGSSETGLERVERIEPIHENTRILVFLKPSATAPPM